MANITVHSCESIKVQIFERCLVIQQTQGSLGGAHIYCIFLCHSIPKDMDGDFQNSCLFLKLKKKEMETKIIKYYESFKLKHIEIQICRGFYGNINLPQSSNIAILKLHREVNSLIMYHLHKEQL